MKARRRVRNRLLGVTRNTIPYVMELREIAGSVSATVLMQQLDYWFIRYPDGFYKFLEPRPKASLYRSGQSWCEELGLSKNEFRSAFDRIGHRWLSKSQFDEAKDKFQGKFYASYVDRRTNLTWYLRNHELVDQTLDHLLEMGNADSQEIDNSDLQEIHKPDLQEIHKADLRKSTNQISGDRQSRSLEIHKPDFLYTENTTEIKEITSDLLPEDSPVPESSSSRFYFPVNFDEKERDNIIRLLAGLDTDTAQNIIDEVVGICLKGQIRQSSVSLAAGLIKRARDGQFNPALAVGIAKRREREQRFLKERRETVRRTPESAEACKNAISEMRAMLKRSMGESPDKENL
ncbi:hypothetical protein LJC19_06395 [Oxalobacter sp. OttesenSCG-928-P03]|nr:hypothetical protein [Oxalobacter sp. OttesenSCG-928-P03]